MKWQTFVLPPLLGLSIGCGQAGGEETSAQAGGEEASAQAACRWDPAVVWGDTATSAARSENWIDDEASEGVTATLYSNRSGAGRDLVRVVYLGESGRATYLYAADDASFLVRRSDSMYVPIPGEPDDSLALCASNAGSPDAVRYSDVLVEALRRLEVPPDDVRPSFLAGR